MTNKVTTALTNMLKNVKDDPKLYLPIILLFNNLPEEDKDKVAEIVSRDVTDADRLELGKILQRNG